MKSKQNVLNKIMQDPARRATLKSFENFKWKVKFFNVIDLKWEPYSGMQNKDKEFYFMI